MIKNKPPMGVMGPIQGPTLNGKMILVEMMYKDPLNKTIPMVMNKAALCIHLEANVASSYFVRFNDNTIKAME
jgi:hypothetical protein